MALTLTASAPRTTSPARGPSLGTTWIAPGDPTKKEAVMPRVSFKPCAATHRFAVRAGGYHPKPTGGGFHPAPRAGYNHPAPNSHLRIGD